MPEDAELLIPNEDYLKSGIHIGTKFRTKHMANFIYKTRPDGLSVLNIQAIDERIRLAVKFLARFAPEDILAVSRRENGWKPAKAFAEATGAKHFAGRYPPGVLTNPNLRDFVEAKIMIITDAWPDKNAIADAQKVGIPVIALCDTNNQANGIDLVVPCNNKGKKSLGLVYYLFAKLYLKQRGLIKKDEDFKYTMDDFSEE
ncbi:30S ribosomal protein S2 [Candidatus Woesearchaeota archaeon]|nr:30S ribosomal protein S2 [Candidatus Woesearchaeota archaeon]